MKKIIVLSAFLGFVFSSYAIKNVDGIQELKKLTQLSLEKDSTRMDSLKELTHLFYELEEKITENYVNLMHELITNPNHNIPISKFVKSHLDLVQVITRSLAVLHTWGSVGLVDGMDRMFSIIVYVKDRRLLFHPEFFSHIFDKETNELFEKVDSKLKEVQFNTIYSEKKI